MSVTVENLAEELDKLFNSFGDDVADILKKASKQTSKETNEVIKKCVEFENRTGGYVRNFATKKAEETRRSVTHTWYVKAPYYRLTHLLEYGHATRNGGRTRAYPHIGKGEEYAEKRMTDLIEVLLNELC